jgi:hypothetical protein
MYKDIEPPTSMEKKPRGKKAAAAVVAPLAALAPPVPAPVAEAPAAEAPVKKFRAKKTVASASITPPVLAPLPAPAPIPVPAPAAIPVPVPAPAPTKKRGPPKKAAASVAPIGIVTSELKEDLRIIDINVKKATINDRSVYLGPKDKVYDLKFKYIGRYSRATDAIVSHPDSDAD